MKIFLGDEKKQPKIGAASTGHGIHQAPPRSVKLMQYPIRRENKAKTNYVRHWLVEKHCWSKKRRRAISTKCDFWKHIIEVIGKSSTLPSKTSRTPYFPLSCYPLLRLPLCLATNIITDISYLLLSFSLGFVRAKDCGWHTELGDFIFFVWWAPPPLTTTDWQIQDKYQ